MYVSVSMCKFVGADIHIYTYIYLCCSQCRQGYWDSVIRPVCINEFMKDWKITACYTPSKKKSAGYH